MSSTTQSHVHTGPQPNFTFNPQRLTQMNTRPDVVRQPGMPQIPQMAAMGAQPHFMQNRQQPEQHGQSPMGMPPNNANPSSNLLGGMPQGNSQRMQQAVQQRRHQEISAHALNAQTMNGSGGSASGPHLRGSGLNQMASIGFPGNIQPVNNSQVHRAQSQSQQMNQPLGQMQIAGGAMHPSQQGGSPMGVSMNVQATQSRQVTQQQQQQMIRMQQIQGSQILPEMAMAIRQPGNPGMSQNMQRSTSAQAPAQIMASLPQPPPPGLTQTHQVGTQSLQLNNFQNPMPHPHPHSQTVSPSPRLGNRSQPQTPANINLPNPGQPQPNANRSQTDIFNFQNQQFSQNMSNNAGQFPFVPSSVSPSSQHGELPQSMGAGTNPSGSNNRGSFQLTPAQQLQSEGYNNFNMPPPQSNVPPRPPSNNNPHISLHQQQQPQHHSSPQQLEHLTGQQPQRPQSQPQTQPRRPPSQSDISNTPRSTHSQLPGHSSASRIPPLSQQPQPGPQALHPLQSSAGHPLPIAPRPPLPASATAGPSSTTSANFPPPEGNSSQGQSNGIQRSIGAYPLGSGQGVTRLLQFSGSLAAESKTKLSLEYWNNLVKEFFAPQSILKFTLWKDNQRNEAKPFDIGVPILPRFFLVTTQSGVKSMTLSLDGARERLLSINHAIVECVTAAWTCKYTNGYTVTLRGPLTAHVVLVQHNTRSQGTSSQPYSLKFENLEFVANFHDKSISLESIMDYRNPELSSPQTPRTKNATTPTANGSSAQTKAEDDKKWEEPRVVIDHASIPGEPVNAFGIPQATMRCLELAESVGQMADLIAFSDQFGTGPIEGLSLYAAKIREAHNPGQGGMNTANGTNSFQNFPLSPAVTLYSSAPAPPNAPSDPQPGPSAGPLQNVASASNSPQKQHKTISQPAGPPSTSGQASGSGSTPSGPSMTPSMSNSSLKRKQTDTASPTTGSEPQKRQTRKRRTVDRGG